MSIVDTRTRVNGVELFHELTGEGEPLVLVHGGWTDLDSWQFVVPSLAGSFSVLAYDRRGHSRSERPAAQGSRRTDEDDLAALIEALDLGPAHLAGNSYGASIALSLACRRPDLVRSVAAHEPPLISLISDEPALAASVAEVDRTMATIVDELRAGEIDAGTARFMEEVALGPGSWALLPETEQRRFMFNAPMFVDIVDDPGWDQADVPGLSSLAVPALVTHGDQSVPWLAAIVAELARIIPGAEHRTFAGAGHAPHLTHADDYAEAIGGFGATAAASPRRGA